MLTDMRIVNFKGFRDSRPSQLRRLTLVLGKNSSGKTAFLQPLLMLAQSVRDKAGFDRNLELNGPFAELGSYRESVHRHDLRTPISLELSARPWRRFSGAHRDARSDADKKYHLGLTFRYSERTEKLTLSEVKHTVGDEESVRRFRGRYQFLGAVGAPGVEEPDFPVPDSQDFLDPAAGFGPRYQRATAAESQVPPAFLDLSDHCSRLWDAELRFVDYIPPIREPGRRYYMDTAAGRAGDYSGGAVAADVRRMARRESELLPFVSAWLERFDIARGIEANRIAEGLVSIRLQDSQTGVVSSVADFGYGTSQVLPLLLYGALNVRRIGRTVVVQQPEVHLHPRAQADLADLFIAVTERDGQAIIETHSEHLVRRIQRRVLEGQLAASAVSILFASKTSHGSRMIEIYLDDQGRIAEEPPIGFMDTGYAEALEFEESLAKRLRGE